MINSEDLVKADRTIRFKGHLMGADALTVHESISRECEVETEALTNFINHGVLNVDRFMRLKNSEKDLIAVAMRHAFAVGCLATKRSERTEA